jgi:hypothetical protein
MRIVRVIVRTAAIAAVLAGCGGGEAGAPAGAGTITWKENGALHATSFASASRVKTVNSDMLQVAGGTASGIGIAFGVVVMPPPLAQTTYTFNGGTGYPIVSMSYQSGGSSSNVPTAISIVLTSLGATTGTSAAGTFTATLPLGNGTTKTLTDGKFDLALTVNSL